MNAILNKFDTSGYAFVHHIWKRHCTNLWNSELVQLTEVILFPQKVDGFENTRLLCCTETNFGQAI